ncbi:MAG: hypothetical protein ACLFTF_08925 [Desulfonatronovibrio sp.]
METELTRLIVAAVLGILGLGVGALIGRLAHPSWAPGLTGAVTGGFGIGALQIAGFGDLGLLPMAGVLVLYGGLVGASTLVAQRKS